jgi:hypothetical protein
LICTQDPGKNRDDAIGSLGARPAAVRWNSGELVAGLGQGNRGEVLVVTQMRFGPERGGSDTSRWGTTAVGVGGARRSGSGELSAGAREWAARTALLGPREGAGGVGRQWVRAERRLHCGGAHGVVASTAACAGRAGSRLNSRGGFLPARRSKDPSLTQLQPDIAQRATGECGRSAGCAGTSREPRYAWSGERAASGCDPWARTPRGGAVSRVGARALPVLLSCV